MNAKSLARTVVYELEKRAQARRFRDLPTPAGGWPILLGISFPKSGTHLLDQILLGFSRVAPFSRRLHSFYAEYEGETGRRRKAQDAVGWLDALGPGDVASAHLFAAPGTIARVASRAFVPYFIFRDPRDVVVSHVFYVTDMESRHVHHPYYASLPDFDARLSVSILGRPELDIEFPDIARRFEPYMGWLDQPQVMKLHFEDLVNAREQALDGIISHFLGRVPVAVPRQETRQALELAINPRASPTFRSGKTGEWKRYFAPRHREQFKRRAGDLLQRLGYEKNDDW